MKTEAARAAHTRAALSPFALEVSPVLRVRAARAPMLQRHTCALTGGVLLMPWGRREFFSLDRSDSKEFLSCSFSFVGSPKHPLRGLNGGLSLGSSNRRWCCATVEPGASVDFAGCALWLHCVRLLSPRRCCHDHGLAADARGSLAFAGLLDVRPKRLQRCCDDGCAARRRWVARNRSCQKIDNRK